MAGWTAWALPYENCIMKSVAVLHCLDTLRAIAITVVLCHEQNCVMAQYNSNDW